MNIRQIIFRYQRRGLQIDLRPHLMRQQIQLRLASRLQGLDRTLQQLGIKTQPNLLNLPALLIAQQFAGAADFQIMGRQHEARPQFARSLDRLQSLHRIRGYQTLGRHDQIGVGPMMRAPYSSANLMELRQTKHVGTIDDDGIGGRYVDAALDDGRAQQHIKALVIEVEHDLLQLPLGHLAMSHANAR